VAGVTLVLAAIVCFTIGGAGWTGASWFFGIAALVMLLQCLPQASYLELTSSGFGFSNRFRKDFVPWSEIARFRVMKIGTFDIVGWDYVAGHARSRALQPVASAIIGADGALPETYGQPGEELARLMNELREAGPRR